MKKGSDRKSLFLGWEGSGYDFHANCRMKTVRWTYLLNNLDKTRNIAFQLVLQNKLDWTRDLGSLYVSGKLPTYPSPKPTLSYICCCLLSALLFPARFFLFRTEYASHDVASSLDLSKDSHIVINISRITFTVLVSSVIVKKVLFRSCHKFREGNDNRNGIYSSPTTVISDAILFVYLFVAPSQKMRARVTRDGTICAKSSAFGYFDGTNPIIGKGIHLRSPTPIMAPDGIWKGKEFTLGAGPPAYKTLLSTPSPSPSPSVRIRA